jgi:hypothetical protein
MINSKNVIVSVCVFVWFFRFFFSTGDWTQSFMCSRQALYHLSYALSPLVFILFLRQSLVNFAWALNSWLSYLCFLSSWDYKDTLTCCAVIFIFIHAIYHKALQVRFQCREENISDFEWKGWEFSSLPIVFILLPEHQQLNVYLGAFSFIKGGQSSIGNMTVYQKCVRNLFRYHIYNEVPYEL